MRLGEGQGGLEVQEWQLVRQLGRLPVLHCRVIFIAAIHLVDWLVVSIVLLRKISQLD